MTAASALPGDADLPGTGWMAIDEGFSAPGGAGPGAAVMDCVGASFPEHRVVGTAVSPHYLRSPATLVHGLGVEFEHSVDADVAGEILRSASFAECLGRSVAADLLAARDAGSLTADLLGVEVSVGDHGHRITFTGSDRRGVRPVVLDVVCVRVERAVGVVWIGDSPGPFPAPDLDHLVARMQARDADR